MNDYTPLPAAGTRNRISRRTAVGGVGAAALAGLALSGCGTDSQPAATPGTVLGSVDEVPVGGGAVFEEAQVVVTQPSEGDYKAFSAVCTHQGCTVREVADGTINCHCHGSRFSMADGAVEGGPADSPLPEQDISVNADGEITMS